MTEGNIQTSNHIADVSDNEANVGPRKKSSNGLTRRQLRVFISLMYNHFWGAACYSIQAPFFPKEAEMKGVSPTEYGMVFSVFELMIIIASPVFGRMIPAVSPKFLMVSGAFLIGGACTIFGVLDRIHSGSTFIAFAFIARIVEGIGSASYATASFTIIGTEFPDSVGKAFSLTETAFGFGLIVGPTVGGALYQAGGFILPFVTCGCLLLIGSLLFFLLIPEIDDVETRRTQNFRKFALNPGVLTHVFCIITAFLLIGFNAGTLEPHLRQFNIKPAILGVIFVITGGVYAFTGPVWGWIADKGVNSYSMMACGYFMTIIGTLLIGPVPFIPFHTKTWTVVLSLVIIGLGMAAKIVAAFTGAVKIAPALGFPDNLATSGMVSGVFSFSCSLGAFIGPSLGGFLLDTTGYEAGTYILLAEEIFFLSLLVAFVLWKKKNTSENPDRSPILSSGDIESSNIVNDVLS